MTLDQLHEGADMTTRIAKKQFAQDQIMHQVAVALGYWSENLRESERDALGREGLEEIQAIMQREADRIAKLFGYEKAWVA